MSKYTNAIPGSKHSPQALAECASFKAFAEHFGRYKDADIVLQPWFLPNSISQAIRTLIPVIHVRKMRFYFDDYGCIRCKRKNTLYGNNGFCDRCLRVVTYRAIQSLKKRLRDNGSRVLEGHVFVDGLSKAQALVKEAAKNAKVGPPQRRRKAESRQ